MKLLLYALLIWFVYNLVFKFIVPVAIASRQVKKRFREMQQEAQDHLREQQKQSNPTFSKPSNPKPAGDYIDFEEI